MPELPTPPIGVEEPPPLLQGVLRRVRRDQIARENVGLLPTLYVWEVG